MLAARDLGGVEDDLRYRLQRPGGPLVVPVAPVQLVGHWSESKGPP